MTTDPSSSLVERVAAAIRDNDSPSTRPDNLDAYHNAARAAIRVVVEACAEVCEANAGSADYVCSGTCKLCATDVRNLIPTTDTP